MTKTCSFVCNASVVIVLFQIFRVVLPWIYKNFIGPKMMGPKVDVRKMGEWALVTGATDGIGKGYATELAKKGLNLVLVSRSKEKLENVAKEIGDLTKVQIKTIDVDFTSDFTIYDKIEKNITGLEIGVLVNNVGMGYTYPEYFLEIQNGDKFLKDIISCNIHSVTHMCRLILPQMVERKKGVIINIASLSATIPNPLLAVYSGTKAFVDKFSQDLAVEYKDKGVIVQSILPGWVSTKMIRARRGWWISPTPETYAKSALSTIGITNRTNGYFPHALKKLSVDLVQILICPAAAASIVSNLLYQAFVDKFSEDLGYEYKAKGIVVQSVLPGFVATNMSKIKQASWISPSPLTYVKAALSTLGISSRTTGYPPHALMKLMIDGVSAITCPPFAKSIVFNQLKNIRSRGLRKAQKQN